MLKLSTIQQLTGFTDPKDARNLADWLREARGEMPAAKLDGEICYDLEFVKTVLSAKFERIQKKYPHAAQAVQKILTSSENDNFGGDDNFGGELHQSVEVIESLFKTCRNPPKQITTAPENGKTTTTQTTPPELSDAPDNTEGEPNGQILEVNKPAQDAAIDEKEPAGDSARLFRLHHGETAIGAASDSGNTQITDPLRDSLTSPRALLWATVFSILIFLPFTALNLWQYIAIKPENAAGQWAVFVLCWLIALIWDFSILLFAVNGKRTLAGIGAAVLFVFMASKFNFFKMVFDAFGTNGESVQLGFVVFCIVSYTPLLLFQLTELAVKK